MDAPSAPTLLFQPRFACHGGDLVGAKLYKTGTTRADSLILADLGDPALAALRAGCDQIAAWNGLHERHLVLSVGASLDTLCEAAFAHHLNAILLETRLEPDCLELNIVTHLDEVSDATSAALAHLKHWGVRFAISAASQASARLAWIKRLPLDCIEVPAGLVQDVTMDPEGVAIVRALVTRAHKMGLSVGAKGITQAHTAAVLATCGCDQLQGPYFGGPLAATDFAARLANNEKLDLSLVRGERPERTLLLVDDEDNILSSLRRLLRRDGYTILTANGGQKGLEVLAANPVDVIISDQRMPGMTGVEFLRKAKDMLPETVRMVLSGYTDLQSVTDAINEGAIYKFLTKPWDDAMLRANIEEAFRRKALSDENRRLTEQLHTANRELARINHCLQGVLAERERRLGMDEASLHLTQEALALLPVPVLGIDPTGMVAFANAAADHIFPCSAPLMGQAAREILPPPLQELLDEPNGNRGFDDAAGRSYRVQTHLLGAPSAVRGHLLVFLAGAAQP